MKHRAFRDTRIGRVGLETEDGRITHVYLPADRTALGDAVEAETPVIVQAFRELDEYFAGKRKVFSVKLAPQGTEFRMRVWAELRKVKFGESISYGELAKRAGSPKASRAVGGAMNKNPIAIFIPCHRVIGSDGSLTGFGGGLPLKIKLLQIENIGIRE